MAELQRTAPVSRSSRHRRKSRGKKKVIILSILFIILGAVFIYAAIIADKYNNLMDQISAQDPEDGVTDAVYGDNSSVKLPKADSDVTTILLLGTDNRPRLGSLNTDVIMLVSLRPDPRSAVIVSMPRDTYGSDGLEGKANGFYAKARSVNKDKAYTYVREILGNSSMCRLTTLWRSILKPLKIHRCLRRDHRRCRYGYAVRRSYRRNEHQSEEGQTAAGRQTSA